LIERITETTLQRIRNPVFRANAELYLGIAKDFAEQVGAYGVPLAPVSSQFIDEVLAARPAAKPAARPVARLAEHLATPSATRIVDALAARGVIIANDSKSFHTSWISPSCVSCRKGVGTATYLFSTQCPRDCFFCFNHNQGNYEQLQDALDDPIGRLSELHAQGVPFHDLALTGGEPLLHKDETAEFFRTAQRLYPEAYTRLYTSGAFLDEEYLRVLAGAGLDEIRFSVKTDDPPSAQRQLFERMRLARAVLPVVVVEMPVMPDELTLMQDLLLTLDDIGIDGINLLELCFPYHNADAFNQRGYLIKNPPYRVLYDYWYAGGLPIAGSEEICLALLDFAVEKDLALGVHYCSLENKFSGQIYLQNAPQKEHYPFCTLSERDYFLKSAKVFGRDVAPIEKALLKQGLKRFRKEDDGSTLEFPLTYVERLRRAFPQLELGVSYHVVEGGEDGLSLRELRLDLTTPETFDLASDG
jgi:pyruvate formate-lyase activating enzyme-like uncharacterized protein